MLIVKEDLVFKVNQTNLFSNYKFNNNDRIIKLYEYDEDSEIIFIPKFLQFIFLK